MMGISKIGHKSHVSHGQGKIRFLQKIGFVDYVDLQLKRWFERYKNERKFSKLGNRAG